MQRHATANRCSNFHRYPTQGTNMTRIQYWSVTVLAALSLLVMAAGQTLHSLNQGLQGDIGLRQQYVQQSLQLETLYREIIRALAELGARHNDSQVKEMLGKHGISYTANAAAPGAPSTAAAPARK
jgi:predicted metal-dependent phosphoesterase TrpH